MNVAVVIPAAGSGTRFGGDIPKQFLELRGMPILVRTIGIFAAMQEIRTIIVAVSPSMMETAQESIEEYYPRRVLVTEGGDDRQQSIYNLLQHQALEDVDVILVHDAVRPLVTTQLVRNLIESGFSHGAAIPSITPKDTIKQLDRNGNVEQTYNRITLGSVQTPQAFRKDILLDSYKIALEDSFSGTDDSSLVEYAGFPVCTILGEEDNIKITTRRDYVLAHLIHDERTGKI